MEKKRGDKISHSKEEEEKKEFKSFCDQLEKLREEYPECLRRINHMIKNYPIS